MLIRHAHRLWPSLVKVLQSRDMQSSAASLEAKVPDGLLTVAWAGHGYGCWKAPALQVAIGVVSP